MDPIEFKKRMRVAREWAGLTSQPDLAAALKRGGETKMGVSTIQKIEGGRSTPSPSQARAIARACNVPEDFLLDESFDPFAPAAEAGDTSDQLARIEQSVIEMSAVLGLQPQARPEQPPRTSQRTEAGMDKRRRVKVPGRSGQQESPAQVHPIQKRQLD